MKKLARGKRNGNVLIHKKTDKSFNFKEIGKSLEGKSLLVFIESGENVWPKEE